MKSSAARLTLLTFLLYHVPGQAQTATADAQGAQPGGNAGSPAAQAAESQSSVSSQLPEVVVTATKRAQSVRDIPSTINVLSGARLEKEGAHQMKDFLDEVPGIKLAEQSDGAQDKLAIRGVGPDDVTNQTVGLIFGDTPLNDPYGSYTIVDPLPWDLKTVEVLKGPQGTLFGASSLAGMVRFVPNAPMLGQWESRGFAEWDSVKNGGAAPTFGAALNVPLGSTAAFRASGVLQHAPGVIDIDTVNRHVPNADYVHEWQGRTMLLWHPLRRLTLNAWWMDQQTHGDEFDYVTNTNGQLSRNDAAGPTPHHFSFGIGTLDARYAFDGATLVSLTSFEHKVNEYNADGTHLIPGELVAQQGIDALNALAISHANGLMQELRLVSPDGRPWTWLLGGFYSVYHASIFVDLYVPNTAALTSLLPSLPANLGALIAGSNGLSAGNETFSPLVARERSVFGELTRTLGPVKITLGARLYRTDLGGVVDKQGAVFAAQNLSLSGTQSALAVGSKGISPKASVAYRPNKEMMFYATASRGFQYGGVNPIAFNPDNDPTTFKSSTLWNYEVGTRTDWFDRTFRFDLTAFYLDWKNAQVDQTDAFPSTNAYVDNVGAVRSRGFESTIAYRPPFIRGLSFQVDGAYTEARTSVPFTDSAGSVPTGTAMPNSPTVQAASTLAYACSLGPWHVQPGLVYTHTNKSWSNILHFGTLEARDMFNFNLIISRSDLSFSPTLSLVVDNVTDQKKITGYRVSTPGGTSAEIEDALGLSGTQVNYTRPRTIQLKGSVDF